MRIAIRVLLPVLLLSLAVFGGCAKNYVITYDLEKPLDQAQTFVVGPITDELPADTPLDKKPTQEHIDKLKNRITEEVTKRDLIRFIDQSDENAQYKVIGSILEYKKGSGAVRFFIGFGLGNAEVVTNLRLIDAKTNETLFAGNFKGIVSDWGSSGDKMFDQVAKDFAKQLEKQLKNLKKAGA